MTRPDLDPPEVAVIGVGQTPYRRRHDATTQDLVGAAVGEALADAGAAMSDVDIVIAGFAPDGLAGENCPDKRFLPAAGAIGRWRMRGNTGGTTGIARAFTVHGLL